MNQQAIDSFISDYIKRNTFYGCVQCGYAIKPKTEKENNRVKIQAPLCLCEICNNERINKMMKIFIA